MTPKRCKVKWFQTWRNKMKWLKVAFRFHIINEWKQIFVLIYSTIHNYYNHNTDEMYGSWYRCWNVGWFVCLTKSFFDFLQTFVFSISKPSNPTDMKKKQKWNDTTAGVRSRRIWSKARVIKCIYMLSLFQVEKKKRITYHIISPETII